MVGSIKVCVVFVFVVACYNPVVVLLQPLVVLNCDSRESDASFVCDSFCSLFCC